jgi:phosphoenolpyruvate synthase/pyruvate phosphate dikinase
MSTDVPLKEGLQHYLLQQVQRQPLPQLEKIIGQLLAGEDALATEVEEVCRQLRENIQRDAGFNFRWKEAVINAYEDRAGVEKSERFIDPRVSDSKSWAYADRWD